MSASVTYYCVFTFDRKGEELTALGPAEYATAAEAEEAVKALAYYFAGALALSLTKDQDTGELLEAKVLIQVGKADYAALVNLFGDT